jgi:tRNA modification GTPase
MSYHPDDTIAAIASADDGAARGIVRVSGRDAVLVASSVFVADDGAVLGSAHQACVVPGQLRFDLNRERFSAPPAPALSGECSAISVPCDLFLWPGTRSYTREPVVELHTIGSPPILQAALGAVCRFGARLAEPGEFTLRAFLAGRLDLTQAEAVLGVIDSVGSDELDTALTQLAGGLARPLHHLRDGLLQLLAELEAGLDFVDEDIRFISTDESLQRLQHAAALLDDVAGQMQSRGSAQDYKQVVLLGAPNAGKSSLFNALIAKCGDAERDSPPASALVSPHKGTTRDYLTAGVTIDGVRCEIVDTAGHETTASSDYGIAEAAQAQTANRRRQATLRVVCISLPDLSGGDLASAHESLHAVDGDIVVFTKSDITSQLPPYTRIPSSTPAVVTSSITGAGLDDLCTQLSSLLRQSARSARAAVIASTVERCNDSVRLASAAVERAAELVHANAGDELVAAELRIAIGELGKVVGVVYTDDLLDRIFKTFCIGK